MTIEQTSQLIQLMLNAVLLVLTCGIVLSALLTRQTALDDRCCQLSLEQLKSVFSPTQRPLPNRPLRSLQRQCRSNQRAILMLSITSAGSIGALFMLLMRSLIHWNGLIQLSMALFIFAVVGLLISLVVALCPPTEFSLVWPQRFSGRSNPSSKQLHPRPSITPLSDRRDRSRPKAS